MVEEKRAPESRNPEWYSALIRQHRYYRRRRKPKKREGMERRKPRGAWDSLIERKFILDALNRIIKGKDGSLRRVIGKNGVLVMYSNDTRLRELIHERLAEGFEK